MSKQKAKILILVEGEKTDVRLMRHLLNVYGISDNHTIVSYNTNIYTLYREMFADGDPSSMDILQLLKSQEKNEERRKIFDEVYSDILLIFDFDPQAPDFSSEKITEMQEYFTESTDMGKLYLNYPMVEAFYHMKNIPDAEYISRCVKLDELSCYKTIVNQENRNHDYTKFAVNKAECDIVISQNIEKDYAVAKRQLVGDLPDAFVILQKQLEKLSQEKFIAVLCTCVYYIVKYNPRLVPGQFLNTTQSSSNALSSN